MKRVLLKLKRRSLGGEKHTGFDEATVVKVAKQVKQLADDGVEVGMLLAEEISGVEEPARILIVPRRIRLECWLP